MLVVGGVVSIYLDHGVRPPCNLHVTGSVTLHSRTHTHPATEEGFGADMNRFTVKAILTLMLEHKKLKTANSVA